MGEGREPLQNGGIAHQHVEPAEALIERRPERVDRLAVGEVERNEGGLAAARPDAIVNLLEPSRAREQKDMRALAGEAGATARPIPREAPVMSAMRSLSRSNSTDFGEEGELLLLRRPFAVPQPCRILAGEAMVGELGMGVVAAVKAHGLVDAVDREELQRVGADEGPHLLEAPWAASSLSWSGVSMP